jgi:hypothetical protein
MSRFLIDDSSIKDIKRPRSQSAAFAVYMNADTTFTPGMKTLPVTLAGYYG